MTRMLTLVRPTARVWVLILQMLGLRLQILWIDLQLLWNRVQWFWYS
jgi:hypothetical protein